LNRHFELVPALDVTDLEQALRLVARTTDLPEVVAYKVGFSLGLRHGLRKVVSRIREHSSKAVIYDHQKAGTDIPDTGALFASTMKDCGVDAAILFPQAGPATLTAWVEALGATGVGTIVGGLMTHRAYLASEGGFLTDDAVVRIYARAWELGVRSFVVPLTKPEATRRILEAAGVGDAVFYSPGLGAQGGDPLAFPFVKVHRLIAGRALLAAPDPAAWVRTLFDGLDAASRSSSIDKPGETP
jgi:orotidine-5'-phosphate decarboxylase